MIQRGPKVGIVHGLWEGMALIHEHGIKWHIVTYSMIDSTGKKDPISKTQYLGNLVQGLCLEPLVPSKPANVAV